MRIDFAARYREVANLLQASTKPATGSADPAFEQDLGTLLLQDTETTRQNPPASASTTELYLPQQALKDPVDDIRASFKFPEPELQLAPVEPLPPPPAVSGPPTPARPEVKTPTVLEVKRVEIPAKVEVSGIPQLDKTAIRSRLVSAAQRAGLDPALAQSVVSAESSFNIRAVSNDGHASKGLFQLLDSTGKHLLSRVEGGADRYDPFNPDLNIKLGTNYLRYLHDIFGESTALPNKLKTTAAADRTSLEKFAVAAFNAGEGRVASAQLRAEALGKDPAHYDQVAPHLPGSTRDYVRRVLDGKRSF